MNDDWRIKSNLSINVGLRWDFQAPVTELYNRLVNLNIGPGFTSESAVCGTAPPSTAASTCTLASQAGYPSSLLRPDYHEFQPRIGIAWRPFTQHSTVVRAGYGIYYNTSVYQPLANQMAQQSPLSYSVTQPNSLSNPYTIADAFLTPAINAVPQTYALDPNFKIGYLHYWQASVQQNLSSSIILTLTYHGNEGTHQLQEFLPNTFPAGSPPARTRPVTCISLRTETPTTTPAAYNFSAASAAVFRGTGCILSRKLWTTQRGLAAAEA